MDLEKALDTVPRKMAMATLRWMGAPESEVKMVEAMHENTKGRVVVGSGMSNEFQVNIGSEKGRGGRKVERKRQQQRPVEANYERSRTSE